MESQPLTSTKTLKTISLLQEALIRGRKRKRSHKSMLRPKSLLKK
jgi:hypothetical protein